MMPMKWRVNFAYYKGRYHLYNSDYANSRTELWYAFENCHEDYSYNKRLILKYLIPIEMTFYAFPTKDLLKKLDLKEYIELSEACVDGDLVKFKQNMNKYMGQFT